MVYWIVNGYFCDHVMIMVGMCVGMWLVEFGMFDLELLVIYWFGFVVVVDVFVIVVEKLDGFVKVVVDVV